MSESTRGRMLAMRTVKRSGVVGVLLTITGFAPTALARGDGADASPKWVSLFNGKDLTGWQTYDIENGFNNDPQQVYSVVNEDGEPAIRISGQILGGLVTRQEFGNYRLRLQYKWGKKK